ncbi:calcium/sodium antiporter [Pseudooceanicola spongiae]|uniref:Calcium/sodium antiporter n=1 Tax=Pseudooceanicola spongiae TaxID=2613965 RepID=A0A7L9WT48_9RHOB|nr:calcium/sodium antiporter [Pseudooceanicola spongiae]QOL82897.1 calcium/sodium antiporter [Pseudooceanicola spongiae]
MLPWLLAVLGLVILLLAGDALVRGAVNLSLRMGIPALIVSLTVVAFGTSAPELLISISAVMDGKPGLALGNVVGSNTANILLVLGIPALLATMHTSEHDSRKSYLTMIVATLVFIGLAMRGTLDLMAGGIMLAMLALILADQGRDVIRHKRDTESAACALPEGEVEGADPAMRWWKVIMFLVIGLVGLPLGAQLLVTNASIIARDFGISETVIGLTLVAVGTSLPELATTVMAALRKQADVALGNVIGSNMFNLLGIMGVTTLIGKVPVDVAELEFDFAVMLGSSLLLVPFVFFRRNITWPVGAILILLYACYIGAVLI